MNETEDAVSTVASRATPLSKRQRVCPVADQRDGAEAQATTCPTPLSKTASATTASGTRRVCTDRVPEVPAKVDVEQYESASNMLASCGADAIKHQLARMGLKCGGTPEARAERLWSTKGKSLSELDPRMFAKKKQPYNSRRDGQNGLSRA